MVVIGLVIKIFIKVGKIKWYKIKKKIHLLNLGMEYVLYKILNFSFKNKELIWNVFQNK